MSFTSAHVNCAVSFHYTCVAFSVPRIYHVTKDLCFTPLQLAPSRVEKCTLHPLTFTPSFSLRRPHPSTAGPFSFFPPTPSPNSALAPLFRLQDLASNFKLQTPSQDLFASVEDRSQSSVSDWCSSDRVAGFPICLIISVRLSQSKILKHAVGWCDWLM